MTQKCDDINKFWQKFQKAVVDSGVSGAMDFCEKLQKPTTPKNFVAILAPIFYP